MVNILTNVAYHKRKIFVFGGKQLRPNIHIDDMIEAYYFFLKAGNSSINNKIFNVGFENQRVEDIAETVRSVIGSDVNLILNPSEDNRSYHISSQKIKKELGFSTKKTIKDAIVDLKDAFDKKILTNTLENENYFNIKKMQSINLV